MVMIGLRVPATEFWPVDPGLALDNELSRKCIQLVLSTGDEDVKIWANSSVRNGHDRELTRVRQCAHR
jgi:hypothetical protein